MDETALKFWQTVMQTAPYAGAIISVVAVVLIYLARAKVFPKLSQKAAFWILGFGLFILFVALLIPPFERLVLRVQTIDVVLRSEANAILQRPFTVRYRTSDRGVVRVEGHDGTAELRGVPVSLEKLDIVDIECGGFVMRDPGPFALDNGKVEVVMVSGEPPPPEDDRKRPDPSVFKPSKDELDNTPAVQGKDVTLFYQNRTGRPLDIVLYNYSHDPNGNSWKLRPKWIDLEPNNSELGTYEGFKNEKGNGWYGVWLRDKEGTYTPLQAMNFFIARQPMLTIESGDPYVVKLEPRKPEDGTP